MANVLSSDGHFLRNLHDGTGNNNDTGDWPELSLIVVPDASTSRVTLLSESSWAWLSPIAKNARVRAHYYEFQCNPASKDAFIWQALNDGGDTLLSLLLRLESERESQSGVVLISNGLGGILAKKVLTRLSERYFDPTVRRFSDRLTQVILVGCPHPKIDDKARWPLLDHVLRHDRKIGSRALKAAAGEAAIVANLCSKFQEAGVQFPVITTYESQPTTIRHRINILKSEKRILVSNEFAETCVRNEEMIPLNLDDRNIRSLGIVSSSTEEFRRLVMSSLAEANGRLRSRTLQRNLDPRIDEGNPFASTVSEVTRSVAPPPVDPSAPANATFATSTDRSGSIGTSPPDLNFEAKKMPRLPCYVFGRHPRNPNFFGRSKILDQVDDCLFPTESKDRDSDLETLRSFAICGIGGIGKTQTALEYAYTRKLKFDAIFWITADTKTSIAGCFSTIALSLGIANEAEVVDLAVSFSIVLRWLSNPTKLVTMPDGGESVAQASWLIIFDNADDIDLISEFWPSTGIGSVLVATRDPAGKHFCHGKGTLLQPLPDSDALEFFMTLLNKDEETEQYVDSDFVERFGGLPFVIVQVASLIRRRQMTISEFSEAYSSGIQQSGLRDFQASQYDGDYRQSIFTVWAFESLDKTTQALLNVMSLLDPFRIQEFILTHERLDLPESLYPKTKGDYVNSRYNLLKASLITRSLPTEHVELHPLVQEVMQARMSEEELLIHFSIAVALVYASWPSETVKWGHETSHREQSGQVLAHALKLRTVYEKSLIDKPLIGAADDLWIENMKESGWYLYERGEHESALPIFILALRIARKRSHEKPNLLADVLMCLAALGLHTSSPKEVLEHSREHLEVRQQVYNAHAESGDVPLQVQYDHAMGVATMAMAHNFAGEFDKSISYADKSLELYQSFALYQDWKTVPYFAVAHTGWALWSLGRHEDAEEVLLKAVNADRRRGAGGSYGLAGLLLPLGNALMAQGKLDDAAAIHEEAFRMFYAANGDNYKTAQGRLKHAEHLGRAGRDKEAWPQYQLVMDAFARNSYYKPELARAQIKAARFLLSIGETARGQELLKRAQSTLDKASVEGKADEMDEESMSKIVRMWSR